MIELKSNGKMPNKLNKEEQKKISKIIEKYENKKLRLILKNIPVIVSKIVSEIFDECEKSKE